MTGHGAWHAQAVTLRASTTKTTCQGDSPADGHLGYNHGSDGEERKRSWLMARLRDHQATGRSFQGVSSQALVYDSLDPGVKDNSYY